MALKPGSAQLLSQQRRALISPPQAASRGWNSYHAILYRHTLGFYEDRKDTLRVSKTHTHTHRLTKSL